MNKQDIRSALGQYEINDKNAGKLSLQIIIVAIALGLWAHSWWIFGIVLIGMFFSLRNKKISRVIVITLSLCWGLVGMLIGAAFDSFAAVVVLGILAFLVGLGINISGLQWFTDSYREDN
ncbi:hypothetical protein GCM10008904_32540 [Paraclostridium ghonii]|uniref:4-hydroxybenzoate polyprenyltransferase n=1 Tax=Paraclostridium ghonii TaxID=29358 RepID=A0ABU0MWW4_9FIRM|nr:hypothetical protein [Paeniclostridium ghonii]MDQ0555341.1 4-hydroxybenzoate polyprenyltransferase [Paeniclostridium ghonii]